MSHKKAVTIFFVLMGLGVGNYFLIRSGSYPVVLVNYSPITEKQVMADFLIAHTYLKNAAFFNGADPGAFDAPESKLEIRRAALDKLVTDAIIYQELQSRMKKSEFQSIARRNVDGYVDGNQDVKEGVKILYSLELDEFKDRVLMPQAYREILEGRMFLEGGDFEEWLAESRAAASVIMLSPDFSWEDGEVRTRQ